MKVKINRQAITLDQQNVIGVGGEATVFRHHDQAIKVFLEPNQQREDKLRAMLPRAAGLPLEVIIPQQLVYDGKGRRVVGFTMRLLDNQYFEIRNLSVKKYRAAHKLTSRDIVRLFLKLHRIVRQIHRAGMVVGDFNDLNVLIKGEDVVLVDVDSFQFDVHPCAVGTEAFADPALYDRDFEAGPVYSVENDWYAFAVHLFKSLLLAHPFGGVHPRIHLLTQRARQGVTVLHKDVKYPRIAYNPELLSDALRAEFDRWFVEAKRGVFPETVLKDYLNNLKDCPACGATYPTERARCPMCSAVVPIISAAQARIQSLFQTHGPIVAHYINGERVRVIAHENEDAVYYDYTGTGEARRVKLFTIMPEATYAFFDELLVISPSPNTDDLMIVDVGGDHPEPILKTTTDVFGGGRAVFGSNGQTLYRIAGGYLVRGQFKYGQLVESRALAVARHQTWFQVAPDADRVFGLFRTFNTYTYWLLDGTRQETAALTPLEPGEFITEISAKFAKASVLVLRRTRHRGADRVRVDEIDLKGRQLQSYITTEVDQFPILDAHAYAQNVIVRAIEDGIMQERLDTRSVRTFKQPESITRDSLALHRYRDGLLVLLEKRALYVTMGDS